MQETIFVLAFISLAAIALLFKLVLKQKIAGAITAGLAISLLGISQFATGDMLLGIAGVGFGLILAVEPFVPKKPSRP